MNRQSSSDINHKLLYCVPFDSWTCDYKFTSGEIVFHWPHELVNTEQWTQDGFMQLEFSTS